MIKPGDLKLPRRGHYLRLFGRYEREAAAAMVVLLHHTKGWEEWSTFELPMMAQLYRDENSIMLGWAKGNPFWQPDFFDLQDRGFIEGIIEGDPKGQVQVTDKFIEAFNGTLWVKQETTS